MKNEIKMLYKKDAKLAREVAAALGYKITASKSKNDLQKIKKTMDTQLSNLQKNIEAYYKASMEWVDQALKNK